MRIALVSSCVPFVYGGARNIVEWLEAHLREAGHTVERIYLPFVDVPDLIFEQMAAFRWVDLSSADRVICFRPPSHAVSHPNKIVWFIHHIRMLYDLWDSPYRAVPDDAKYRGVRDALHEADTRYLREAKRIFTNSRVVASRLLRFNGLRGEVLYPPIDQPERFRFTEMNDEIACVCRVEHHKRQHLLIEALKLTRTPVRLRLCGAATVAEYPAQLRRLATEAGIADRVILQDGWIPEDEKIDILSRCLAAAYVPLDEDSYGYPSLEASHSRKPILTTDDSGGVLELVEDGYNGLVAPADPGALAAAMDRLYLDREKTRAMGENAQARLGELGINWSTVLEKLLS
jgi:glycosyltransferase involved in cell wall biosynthesis